MDDKKLSKRIQILPGRILTTPNHLYPLTQIAKAKGQRRKRWFSDSTQSRHKTQKDEPPVRGTPLAIKLDFDEILANKTCQENTVASDGAQLVQTLDNTKHVVVAAKI
jgi:hypothetical protein